MKGFNREKFVIMAFIACFLFYLFVTVVVVKDLKVIKGEKTQGEKFAHAEQVYLDFSNSPVIKRIGNFLPSTVAVEVFQAVLDCWDGGFVDDLFGFVLAMICTESSFVVSAVGKSGEIGLMQISPFWTDYFAIPKSDLFDAYVNVCVGLRILSDEYRKSGDIFETLFRYNGARSYKARVRYVERFFECAEKVRWQNVGH